MQIKQFILEAKNTKDKELINKIIKYYEPVFCYNVKKHYGKEYDQKAKDILPFLVNYYFEKGLRDELNSFLRKRSTTIFNYKKGFNQIIHSENSKLIKLYYEDKLYEKLKNKCDTVILDDNNLRKLSTLIIKNTYDNYLKNNNRSTVYNYFNNVITRKVNLYQNEEKMLLDYCLKIGTTKKIKLYFYSKYMYIFDEFRTVSIQDYEKIIDDTILKYKSLHVDFEKSLKNRLKSKTNEKSKTDIIKQIKTGNWQNLDEIKNYYSYIIDLVFNKYKDKVFISQDTLKEKLTNKYDDYFNAAINSIKMGNNISLQRYINTRLSNYVAKNKSYFNVLYVDDSQKEKNIKDYIKIVDKYAIKYAGTCPINKITSKLTDSYYFYSQEYYTKVRKFSFDEYIKGKMRQEAKLFSDSYKDSKESKLVKK